MQNLVAWCRARIESPGRRKFIKYSMVSVVSVAVTQVFLFTGYHWGYPYFGALSAGWAAFWASTIAAFPSYYLNRAWVWRKSGRSHLGKEVLPFWIMAFIGIGFSALVGLLSDDVGRSLFDNRVLQSLFLNVTNVAAFAVLWVGKFIIFNKILFAHHQEDLDPALDGRSGLPT